MMDIASRLTPHTKLPSVGTAALLGAEYQKKGLGSSQCHSLCQKRAIERIAIERVEYPSADLTPPDVCAFMLEVLTISEIIVHTVCAHHCDRCALTKSSVCAGGRYQITAARQLNADAA